MVLERVRDVRPVKSHCTIRQHDVRQFFAPSKAFGGPWPKSKKAIDLAAIK